MANQYFNFSYNPVQQGYDSSTWRTVYGDVAISGGKLRLTKAAILHYGDILRADSTFSINIAAPVAGDNTKIGLLQYNKDAYLYFQISDGVLTAEASNGTTTSSSSVIDWDTSWTDTDTEFRIKWEAGQALFYIGGQFKAVLEGDSIPGCPLSLYVSSDSTDLLLLDYILVKSIQSFVMSEGNADSTFEPFVTESDRLSISSVVTDLVITPLHVNSGIISEAPMIRESITVTRIILLVGDGVGIVTDSASISDVVTVGAPA